ncbi:hypothetical protein P8C59_003429 [Phyllachora maydis]|uniref:TOM core complex subunit Tom6 n=1 Tax=Phyllachora maydis TaxID=1825666 RepID=A0AAD9I098_9PEZI|nr:hypothetical protein P8C59_003429 [Phyllachora maydis]
MAPGARQVLVGKSGAGAQRGRAPKGVLRSTYDALTSPDNAAVVKSLTAFGVAVAFLVSPWAEFLNAPA